MKHDWNKIKTEYITTDISTRGIAAKYNTTQAEISKRCSNEKWVILRSEHRDKVMSKAVQKTIESRSDLLCNELLALDCVSNAISALVADPLQFRRYIITNRTGHGRSETEEMVFDKYDTKALKDVAYTLAIIVRLKLEIAGVLSERDKIMTSIAQQKLEIERLRFELEQKKLESPESKEIRVILSDEIMEWSK